MRVDTTFIYMHGEYTKGETLRQCIVMKVCRQSKKQTRANGVPCCSVAMKSVVRDYR